uniref:Uncharacterized protein n=1 Tax=Anguilla anguilla TaxID=7936 RepID=A0A0E9QN71_ANGAN
MSKDSDNNDAMQEQDITEENETHNDDNEDETEDLTYITEQRVVLDTSLQPVDIASEILDQHFDSIICCPSRR